jgi:hypothetical protein
MGNWIVRKEANHLAVELAQQVSERTDFVLLTEEALVSRSLQAIQRTLRKQEPWSYISDRETIPFC